MESWSYGSEGKGLLFTDEMDFPVDAFARGRRALIGWDLKPSTDFEAVESMELMDFGFADMNKKPFYGNPSMGTFGAEFGNDSGKRVASPSCMITSSSYYEEESGSKHSSSLMESNSQESSLIDLKLGRLTDYRDAQAGKFIKETSVVSSIRPALMAKKARTTSFCCQVYGCNKDLSSSKDYHKRHKVCEAHSKTAKVIVNGIEQRFCQQCSRFHLLPEFDDGKRSCRKRLAGHNERRRKLHFNTFSGKSHKLLQSCQGTKFPRTSIPKGAPFVVPNIFQDDFVYPERYDHTNQCQQVKSEEKLVYSPQSAILITNDRFPPKSFFHMHGSGKQCIPGTSSSATEAFNTPNAAATVKEFPGVSCTDCALSLLSAQSQNFSSHGTGIQMSRPLIGQACHAHHSSGKSAAVCSLEKEKGFYSGGMNPMGAASVVVSDAGHTVNFEGQAEGYFQDSDLLSAKYCLPPENGSTVDLLQLSTLLQRVERQRNSMQVKQENEDLCSFLTTYSV